MQHLVTCHMQLVIGNISQHIRLISRWVIILQKSRYAAWSRATMSTYGNKTKVTYGWIRNDFLAVATISLSLSRFCKSSYCHFNRLLGNPCILAQVKFVQTWKDTSYLYCQRVKCFFFLWRVGYHNLWTQWFLMSGVTFKICGSINIKCFVFHSH